MVKPHITVKGVWGQKQDLFCIYAIYFHYDGSISNRCISSLRLETIFALRRWRYSIECFNDRLLKTFEGLWRKRQWLSRFTITAFRTTLEKPRRTRVAGIQTGIWAGNLTTVPNVITRYFQGVLRTSRNYGLLYSVNRSVNNWIQSPTPLNVINSQRYLERLYLWVWCRATSPASQHLPRHLAYWFIRADI
jgi:hypothetical protein